MNCPKSYATMNVSSTFVYTNIPPIPTCATAAAVRPRGGRDGGEGAKREEEEERENGMERRREGKDEKGR